MAIKKTAKMSAAPKKVAAKVVAKKADPGKGFVSKVKENMNTIAKNTRSKPDTNPLHQFYQEKPAKKNERYFESPDKKYNLTLKGFPKPKKK